MYVGEKPPSDCFQTDDFGTPVTCTKVNGEWVVSESDGFGSGSMEPGIPPAFGVFFLLAIVASIAFTVWKVSTARRMARESGMSEGDATAMALLTDDGFEATYMASNVRGRTADRPAPSLQTPSAPQAPAADRLAELRRLLDQGLVTQDEYDAARRRIIDGL